MREKVCYIKRWDSISIKQPSQEGISSVIRKLWERANLRGEKKANSSCFGFRWSFAAETTMIVQFEMLDSNVTGAESVQASGKCFGSDILSAMSGINAEILSA